MTISVAPGARIGAYEVIAAIGAGGMGEVYRARDTRLQRDVALKILPEAFAADAERLARFEREAQVLASLNHPNIAQIYGIEEGPGRSGDDTDDTAPRRMALVMELVDGETLADRLARGAIPLGELLPIARQVAEAIEAAHEKGIVHRDVKPANICVTGDGTVKVLDFGLAAVARDAGAGVDVNGTHSPTLTIAASRAGIIMGTAAYMSPEQASGKAIDKRSDIWSYGVVLFELLTGERLFAGGDTVSHLLADVLRAPIDLSRLPHHTPAPLRELIDRCLDRHVKTRLRDIGEARIALERAGRVDPQSSPSPAVGSSRSRPWAGAAAIVATLAAVGATTAWWQATQPRARPFMRFSDDAGVELALTQSAGPSIAVSADGQRLAFVIRSAERATRLAVRSLGSAKAAPLAGTEGAAAPAFSPDGRWLAFFADTKLKKIPVEGGAAITLCEVTGGQPRGLHWGADGNILFAAQRTGLMRVSAAGGTPAAATERRNGEATNRFGQLLPGGQAFLFSATEDNNNWTGATIQVQTIRDGKRKTLVTGGYFGRYLAATARTGYLLYLREGTVLAAPMDLDRLELTGEAIPLIDDATRLDQNGFAQLDVSESGTLVYVPGINESDRGLALADVSSKVQLLRSSRGSYVGLPRPSPDGSRIAIRISDQAGNTNVSIYELESNRMTRLTFLNGRTVEPPVWAPDGKHLVFAAITGLAKPGLFWMRADGAGEPRRLSDGALQPSSFAPDGTRLAYIDRSSDTSYAIAVLPLDLSNPERPKAGTPEVLLRSSSPLAGPAFSPDGRWIAYGSNETQPPQIFVRPSSASATGKWQVSTDGGSNVTWSRTRRELFYVALSGVPRVVPYKSEGDSFSAGAPETWGNAGGQPLFTGPPQLMPDGGRLVGILSTSSEPAAQSTHVTLLLNLSNELSRRLSAAR